MNMNDIDEDDGKRSCSYDGWETKILLNMRWGNVGCF